MTVKEVFEKALKDANDNRNNWVDVIKINELNHCYVSQVYGDHTCFTLFLNATKSITLIRPMNNQIGISIDSNYFIYSEVIRVVDMQTEDEFIINKDGIIDDNNRIY